MIRIGFEPMFWCQLTNYQVSLHSEPETSHKTINYLIVYIKMGHLTGLSRVTQTFSIALKLGLETMSNFC